MKTFTTLVVLGTLTAACTGGTSEEASSPTSLPIQQTPNTPTTVPTVIFTPTTAPANISPTNTPVSSPTAQSTNTATPEPTATVEPATTGTSDDVAADGDEIAVHYTGTLDNGDVFDTSRDGDPPLEFVLGAGQMIPGFEKAVRGMIVGEVKTVRLSPDEAYGEADHNLILELPREGAPEGLEVGDMVRLSNGIPVTIVEITEEVVVIDANHRLAGEALTFEIEVVSIN